MTRKLTLLTTISFLLSLFYSADFKAQDAEFTQFYANPLYLNPAFAGSYRCPRIVYNFRNQWPNIAGTYNTHAASYDQHIDAISGGIGIMFLQDDAGQGTLKTTTASIVYSYFLPVTKSFNIKAGIQATYYQKALDWSKLTFGDMIDQQYGFISQTAETNNGIATTRAFDISAGLLGYSRSFYIGGAVNHILQHKESFLSDTQNQLPMKITGHVGAIITTGDSRKNRRRKRDNPNALPESSISPNILYRKQRDFQQLNLGVYVTKGPIVGGLWYRNRDSFIALVGLQFQNFRFGYSYDITVSKLSANSAGSHEISASILFSCRPKKKRFAPVACPSF